MRNAIALALTLLAGPALATGLTIEVEGEANGTIQIDLLEDVAPKHVAQITALAAEGKYDGVMLLTRNKDRSRYLSFSVAVHQDANVVWALKSRTFERDFRTFKDFQGLRIGLTEGFNYGEAFDQAVKEYRLKVDPGPTILSNMLRLALGRIDIFLVNRVAGESAIEDRPNLRKKLTHQRGPFKAVPFFIGLSKSSPIGAEVPRFNEALEDMKQDGTINRIFGADRH